MPLQYKNTFLEFVPAVPELKRSKTSPDLTFTLTESTEQKFALDRVDSEADTEYRSAEESTEGGAESADENASASHRRPITGPLWVDMTDDDDDDEVLSLGGAPAAQAAWADLESDEDDVASANAPADVPAARVPETKQKTEVKQPGLVDDGWTTVVTKKGKKGRR